MKAKCVTRATWAYKAARRIHNASSHMFFGKRDVTHAMMLKTRDTIDGVWAEAKARGHAAALREALNCIYAKHERARKLAIRKARKQGKLPKWPLP